MKKNILNILLLIILLPFVALAQGSDGTAVDPTLPPADPSAGTTPSTAPADSGATTTPNATPPTQVGTPTEVGAKPTPKITPKAVNPAPAPTPTVTPEPLAINYSDSSTSPSSTSTGNIQNIILGIILAAGVAVMAFFGLNMRKKKDKQDKEKSQQKCLNFKKLMEEKMDELTDLKGQLTNLAKEKGKDTVKGAIAGTKAGDLLIFIEKRQKEYDKLKELYEKCIVGLPKNMKIILVDAVHAFVSKEGQIFKEMHDLLETYPNKKIILTGANDEEFKKFMLDKMPYEVFTLRHNPEKTNPKYYEMMFKHFNLTKEDVIYFEHSLKAVESARSLGIDVYFYDNEKRDLVELKRFLDKKKNAITKS